ncbi:Uncharacterised protein [Providencia rustigianii]|nr:Uncharacterised protein [Providencia rustigianii]
MSQSLKNNCSCGNPKRLTIAALPSFKSKLIPETAEQLMRSRYSAYVHKDADYLIKNMAPRLPC